MKWETRYGTVNVLIGQRRRYGGTSYCWLDATINGVPLDLFRDPWPSVTWPKSAIVWELRTLFPDIRPTSADVRWRRQMERERRVFVGSWHDGWRWCSDKARDLRYRARLGPRFTERCWKLRRLSNVLKFPARHVERLNRWIDSQPAAEVDRLRARMAEIGFGPEWRRFDRFLIVESQ